MPAVEERNVVHIPGSALSLSTNERYWPDWARRDLLLLAPTSPESAMSAAPSQDAPSAKAEAPLGLDQQNCSGLQCAAVPCTTPDDRSSPVVHVAATCAPSKYSSPRVVQCLYRHVPPGPRQGLILALPTSCFSSPSLSLQLPNRLEKHGSEWHLRQIHSRYDFMRLLRYDLLRLNIADR